MGKHVSWNRQKEGFQECWLWQFGLGPFILLKKESVPQTTQYLGLPNQISVPFRFEPGEWYTIALSDESKFYRDYRVENTMFHEKWFLPIPMD